MRVEFMRRPAGEIAPTPMMRLLGRSGGRGGDVRFKLYLSLLWGSPAMRDGQHDTLWPATDWAQLLGLPRYSTKGRHRIYESINWLDEHEFISKVQRPGKEPRVVLRSDTGDGGTYTVPSSNATTGGPPSYRQLQSEWWLKGWMATLSGRALAFWIVLLDRVSKDAPAGPVWIAESVTTREYGMSPYLRQNAMRELATHDLIAYRRRFVKKAFGMQSSRTEIALNVERLTEPPNFRP